MASLRAFKAMLILAVLVMVAGCIALSTNVPTAYGYTAVFSNSASEGMTFRYHLDGTILLFVDETGEGRTFTALTSPAKALVSSLWGMPAFNELGRGTLARVPIPNLSGQAAVVTITIHAYKKGVYLGAGNVDPYVWFNYSHADSFVVNDEGVTACGNFICKWT